MTLTAVNDSDLPCVLPLSLYSGIERNSPPSKTLPSSCKYNDKSSGSGPQESNMDSQAGSKIPTKRKKRSSEEITGQRTEALVSITFIIKTGSLDDSHHGF